MSILISARCINPHDISLRINKSSNKSQGPNIRLPSMFFPTMLLNHLQTLLNILHLKDIMNTNWTILTIPRLGCSWFICEEETSVESPTFGEEVGLFDAGEWRGVGCLLAFPGEDGAVEGACSKGIGDGNPDSYFGIGVVGGLVWGMLARGFGREGVILDGRGPRTSADIVLFG